MVTYNQVTQRDDSRYGGSSPAAPLSPALSSSPIPFHPASKSSFTPLSMNSDTYSHSHDVRDSPARDRHAKFPAFSAATRTATASIGKAAQSLVAARATTGTKHFNNTTEYDFLSPSPGELDVDSSAPGSPELGNFRPGVDTVRHLPNTRETNKYIPFDSSSSYKANATSEADRSQLDRTARSPITVSAEKSPTKYKASSQDLHDQSTTTIVRPKPILRTASTKSVTLRHPAPDIVSRSSSRASNIAQLEATAEKLSLTSSFDDAIRDLHEEQKRSESRKSSILAASLGSVPFSAGSLPLAAGLPFARQFSGTDSILETNNAARLGGYSPAGYVMSPSNSLLSNPSRLRSGSYTRSDPDSDTLLSRQGTGKGSVRSIKSVNKPSLGDIAEMPSNLTLAAMDEADRLEEEPEEDETTLQLPHLEDADATPYADQNHYMASANDYWDHAVAEAQREDVQPQERLATPGGSTGTYEQAEMAFADFDGAHCSPDGDSFDAPPFGLDSTLGMKPEQDMGPESFRPRLTRPTQPRPQSYMDPETGQQMLYYPARVPAMLNLPQKLAKNTKATAARNARRSQILSAMPAANRQSRLPETLPEMQSAPMLGSLGYGSDVDNSSHAPHPAPLAVEPVQQILEDELQSNLRPHPGPVDQEARKSRMSVAMSAMDPVENRQSRMPALEGLPPQLRASAFFELPSESPKLELKNGSAMATLDSILDASAKAPVSAFTDHAFAGKLGSEVYGTERKRKSHMKRASTADVLEVKKRSSMFHLRTPSKLSNYSSAKEEARNTSGHAYAENGGPSEERDVLSGSIDGEPVVEDEEEYEEEDPAYDGPPTTLLAELQIRKQQQKMRTRPTTAAYPNGMHSTLLEMDSVAEVERRNRLGKKVNLAWEEPGLAVENDSEDEDLPLGLLMATKKGQDVRDLQMDLVRPLGLMERRELDDNEPLSRRRDRLQGREPALGKRKSVMSLGGGALGMSGGLGPPSPRFQVHTPEEDEVEGETLGERRRRIQAREDGSNALPRARPVSTAFSVELLGQLGDTFKGQEADKSVKGKEIAQPEEEEETLGQRRRRLQAEREAREKEMGAGSQPGTPSAMPPLAKRHSMADVLGRNSARRIASDPRIDAERARQEEASRFKREQEQKLAALRSQMPTNLSSPNLTRSGGYMAGHYNGIGGGIAQRASMVPGGFASHNSGMANGMGVPMSTVNGGMVGNGYALGAAGGGMPGYNMPNGYGAPMAPGYGMMPMQMQFPMPMQQPGQQYDMVDRWRQNIVP